MFALNWSEKPCSSQRLADKLHICRKCLAMRNAEVVARCGLLANGLLWGLAVVMEGAGKVVECGSVASVCLSRLCIERKEATEQVSIPG